LKSRTHSCGRSPTARPCVIESLTVRELPVRAFVVQNIFAPFICIQCMPHQYAGKFIRSSGMLLHSSLSCSQLIQRVTPSWALYWVNSGIKLVQSIHGPISLLMPLFLVAWLGRYAFHCHIHYRTACAIPFLFVTLIRTWLAIPWMAMSLCHGK
jgi:hypothetical protein